MYSPKRIEIFVMIIHNAVYCIGVVAGTHQEFFSSNQVPNQKRRFVLISAQKLQQAHRPKNIDIWMLQ